MTSNYVIVPIKFSLDVAGNDEQIILGNFGGRIIYERLEVIEVGPPKPLVTFFHEAF